MTLLEIIFTITLVTFLIGAISFVYIVSLRGWKNLGQHTDLHEKLHFGLERIIRDVRQANNLSVAGHALRFTVHEAAVNNSYIYYLHNPSDCPPAYTNNQAAYDLRRAGLAGGIFGAIPCGAGELIISGLKRPDGVNDTQITGAGNLAFLTLVGQDENETSVVRGHVHPRNIP